MPQNEVLDEIGRELRRSRELAERALEQIDDAAFFRDPGAELNSVAIIVKHMAGNMRSRWTEPFTTDGEKPDRDRDGEFELRDGDTRANLMARWSDGWQLVEGTVDELRRRLGSSPGILDDLCFKIRGEPHTPLQALLRQVSHYAYHAGQIVLVCRIMTGGRWKTLSIARGRSQAFNDNPAGYLKKT